MGLYGGEGHHPSIQGSDKMTTELGLPGLYYLDKIYLAKGLKTNWMPTY